MGNVNALGYIGIGARDLDAWARFAAEILDMRVTRGRDGDQEALFLRMDERAHRIVVTPGDDELTYIGWEVATPRALEGLMYDLEAGGVPYKEDPALAAHRGVTRLITCSDPAGRPLEFYFGGPVPQAHFVSPSGSQFVTRDPQGRDLGLGHVVLTFSNVQEALDFYLGVLDFRTSDYITIPGGGVLTFTHVNARHHSLALAQVAPGREPGLNHFMLEVSDIDMVGRALDRVHAADIHQIASLGRHTNDRMLSFYVRSPSGFGVEYGTQGRLIDDANWEVGLYDAPQSWGHERALA
jgi:3,4-dihydroxy-9,10-secoandrosta-1,3,5(10)-triene-9,17-dione 4,5-dioxygenase